MSDNALRSEPRDVIVTARAVEDVQHNTRGWLGYDKHGLLTIRPRRANDPDDIIVIVDDGQAGDVVRVVMRVRVWYFFVHGGYDER